MSWRLPAAVGRLRVTGTAKRGIAILRVTDTALPGICMSATGVAVERLRAELARSARARRREFDMNRRGIGAVAVGLLTVGLFGTWVAPATGHADPPVARDADVIVEWNRITERTVFDPVNAPQPIPTSLVWYAFTALAMYDAVVTIEGRYEPWSELPRAHAHASPGVAAATAAYRVLVHYFPNSAEALTADYDAALAAIPEGVGKVHGIRVGEDAAASLIARRVGDGINAAVPQPETEPFEAGEWRPTPPGSAPMVGTWLGFVKPLLIPSPTHFPLDGPPALDSPEYAAEFAEVRDYGGAVSLRSDEQTDTALFHTVAPRIQHLEAIRDQIADRDLDIVDSARALAVFNGSLADVSIACWRAKYDFKFWRPVTAIALADTDGNPGTELVPGGWAPLRNTPPYPDYPSGHACFTGSVSGSLDNLFGTDPLDPAYTMPSMVENVADRSYTSTDALDTETMNARIWNGFHFRTAMTDGNALGHDVADYVFANYFQPTD
jgi:hypothetical protein